MGFWEHVCVFYAPNFQVLNHFKYGGVDEAVCIIAGGSEGGNGTVDLYQLERFAKDGLIERPKNRKKIIIINGTRLDVSR